MPSVGGNFFCSRQKKKGQLALALDVAALGPVPTIPGGWGLRNPKPKEPDQSSIFLSQLRAAGGWQKWGGIMILANDPVTRATRSSSLSSALIDRDLFGSGFARRKHRATRKVRSIGFARVGTRARSSVESESVDGSRRYDLIRKPPLAARRRWRNHVKDMTGGAP